MKTLSISEASGALGRVADQALRGETVIIVRKSRLLQLQEYKPIEPIPMRPPGVFYKRLFEGGNSENEPHGGGIGQTDRLMKQWEIRLFHFITEGPHPAVIISSEERCGNPDHGLVNALICTSAKLNRGPKATEVVLDESDGLDWKTGVRCDVVYLLPKESFRGIRGEVTPLRRALITRKLIECLRLPL